MQNTIRVAVLALATGLALPLGAQNRAPIYTPGSLEPNQQLAHDIYKELIELNTANKTGSVTQAANAV
ncbi:MAG TPA: hypothetical protein VH539_04935, partial [Gemmatimonadaceae bacterium]